MSDRHPEFEAALAEARMYPQLWRLIVGVLLIVLIYVSTTVLIFAIVAGVVASAPDGMGIFRLLPYFQELQVARTPGHILLLLSTFFGMALGPILAAAALHFRGPATLFGEFGDWLRGFLVALGISAIVLGGFLTLGIVYADPVQNMVLADWLKWLPLAIPLLFLQIGAEELLFRGYLQQQLAARFASRIIWMWIPAIIFSLLHWNPDAGANLPLVLLSTLSFGLIAADLTERTGSLGAAMGLHFANNFLALFVVTLGPDMTGLALYVSAFEIGTAGVVSLSLALNITILFGIWWAIKRVLDR